MAYAKILATSLAAGIASLALFSSVAFAQSSETFVSAAGSGTSCSRTAPCANFSAAYNATAAGGAITVLDSGNFDFFTITKSLTVRAPGPAAGVTVADGFGYALGIYASASDTVVLDGLSYIGPGINIQGSGTVIIRNCRIGFDSNPAGSALSGIRIAPTGPLQVIISDTVVESNGNANGGAGIHVIPQSGGSARVMLERVTASHNQFGVAADGSQSTAGVNLTIKDSTLSANVNDGLVATTSGGHAPIGVLVSNTASTNNAYGIRSIGSNVIVRVKGSEIAGNGIGLTATSGGALLSLGENAVQANGTKGAFSGTLALE
jgi:hypothetical protein